nr:HAD family hydrolase [Actinomyces sp.]
MTPADHHATTSQPKEADTLPPVRLLSTDLDGTIIFDGRVRPEDAEAMRRWREAGHLLVMNTGRSRSALASALEGSGVGYDYAVLYTGAVLLDQAGTVLRARTLPDGVVDEVLEALSTEDPITIFATTMDGDLQIHDTIGSGSELLTLFTKGTTADLAGRAVVGIPLRLGRPQEGERILATVRQRWGQVLDGARNQDFLDLVPAGATKGTGLTGLVELLTAPGGAYEGREILTYTVGDSWNDIPMHEAADCAVAMGGAPDEVVAACDVTTPSVAALVDWVLTHEEDGSAAHARWRTDSGENTWPLDLGARR